MQLGTVKALYRYPVKAMGAELLDAADVGWFGISGDRRYAFVRGDNDSDFPWLTIRQVPAMTRYRPASRAEPESGPPRVLTPDGAEYELTSPELADELAGAYGAPVRLMRDHRGNFDSFPLSLVSVQTADGLGELAGGRSLEPLRFRPNVVIDAPGHEYPEDALIGHTVSVGAVQVRVDIRDERCMVINFDPRTADRDPAVLRAAARHRDVCVGVYGTIVTPGLVRVGDPVRVD